MVADIDRLRLNIGLCRDIADAKPLMCRSSYQKADCLQTNFAKTRNSRSGQGPPGLLPRNHDAVLPRDTSHRAVGIPRLISICIDDDHACREPKMCEAGANEKLIFTWLQMC